MGAGPLLGPNLLGETGFGSALPPSARSRLAPYLTMATYQPGDLILREGDPTTALGIVARGRVALRLRVPERGPTTILTVEAGDVIGWSAVVPPYRATSTVIALLPTDLVRIDGPALREALDADPVLAAAVYPALLRAMARRLTGTRLQLLDLFAASGRDPW